MHVVPALHPQQSPKSRLKVPVLVGVHQRVGQCVGVEKPGEHFSQMVLQVRVVHRYLRLDDLWQVQKVVQDDHCKETTIVPVDSDWRSRTPNLEFGRKRQSHQFVESVLYL